MSRGELQTLQLHLMRTTMPSILINGAPDHIVSLAQLRFHPTKESAPELAQIISTRSLRQTRIK
eukprot:5828065-Pyramimonas_sp.AAC.1